METRIRKNTREEIVVDDVPIGNVLLDDDGKVHWAELYSDFIHTHYEAKLLKQFADKINEYEWVEHD
jgi:tRNA(Arg) A34 adenosine deaminase TadA